jgi:5'-phosphate synthase pdxT subunit
MRDSEVSAPRVGVLALQGAFAAHARILQELGAGVREVRTPADLDLIDGLVIPGGESTTMTLGIEREGLAGPLRAFRDAGKAIFGTCAGLIMLDRRHLGLMDIVAERNAFGRQVFSFEENLDVVGIDGRVRAIFIRAPQVAQVGSEVSVLARVGRHPVAVEQDRVLAISFHPELAGDTRLHQRFLHHVGAYVNGSDGGTSSSARQRPRARTESDRPAHPAGRPPGVPRTQDSGSVPTLLLFDIDGTLLDLEASAAHRDAVYAALRSVYGVEDPAAAGVQTWGKTDLQIGREILEASGDTAGRFHERSGAYCRAAARRHETLCAPDLSGHVIAGIPELLTRLAARDDVILGLVTGNVREIAQLKLARAGLNRFFTLAPASYGCETEDRAELPALARARAATTAHPHPRERTWVIGDTPHDIRCAHADGIRCIAVTSGPSAAEDLQLADHVAQNTDELGALLERQLGSSNALTAA